MERFFISAPSSHPPPLTVNHLTGGREEIEVSPRDVLAGKHFISATFVRYLHI